MKINKALFYKTLSITCTVAIVVCLAMNIFLSLGYIYPKWSGPSVKLGFGMAISAGALVMGAIYFAICAAMESHNAKHGEVIFD